MKKNISFLLCIISIIFLSACSNLDRELKDVDSINSDSSIPIWLSDFYNGNYKYQKSTIVVDDQKEIVTSVVEGEKVASPYTEYVKVIKPVQTAWSEAYYYGDGDNITSLINTPNGYVSQQNKREYPYGYGQDLKFTKDGTIEYEEALCDIYTAEYTQDIAEQMNQQKGVQLSESLIAVISIEYYVDSETDQLRCMITDISDLNAKSNIGITMMTTGVSLEEARKQNNEEAVTKEKLEILSYDDNLSIDIPNT